MAETVSAAVQRFEVTPGDVVAVSSWSPWRIVAHSPVDAFMLRDAPASEAVGRSHTMIEARTPQGASR